jgi:pimeloyl-ACP methyl ester carboxylesterase
MGLAAWALACSQIGCRSVSTCSLHATPPAPALVYDFSLAAAQDELAHAAALEAAGHEQCIDAYFRAANLAWRSIGEEMPGPPSARERRCYGESVAGLLFAAQRFGRLDPARGLTIREGDRSTVVPALHHGFAWTAADFQRLVPPPTRHEPLLTRRYGWLGLGVPLVVERRRNDGDPIETRFFPEKSFFAATALLRFRAPMQSPDEPLGTASEAVLEFNNPLRICSTGAAEGSLPLAADLSAPLALTLEEAPRSYFAGFIEPGGATTTARLNLLEPYQRGKVPVVLIHGLFSDPQSWADLVNDLRAAPGFAERFQLWVFRYPTGQGFLQSAAALRTELRAAVEELDPGHGDPALHRIVLVGHSMGGLIAKLQVTHSDELIWNRLANRPLEDLTTTESTRAVLAETCYFDPSPDVARVIFIASPHSGSLPSSELIGQGAALLVEPSPQQASLHEQLIRENPNTFSPFVARRFPTSIDMLAPRSPLLEAMRQMLLRPGLALHSVIGVSHPVSLDGPSDGVVSVHSAAHPGCRSVLAVNAPHAKVHRMLQTSAEVLRILECHWQESAVPAR